MGYLSGYSADISRILNRSFRRSEFASGLTSLVIILTMIVVIRFSANIYLFFSIRSAGNTMNLLQIWGGLLFTAAVFSFSGGFIQGYKLRRYLPPTAAVFQPSRGKTLLGRLKLRMLLYRPLAAGLLALLFGFGIAIAIGPGRGNGLRLWSYYFITLALLAIIYPLISRLSEKSKLEEFEARLLEVLILSALVFSNPDFLRSGDVLSLSFFRMPLPFDAFIVLPAGLLGIGGLSALLIVFFSIGRGFLQRAGEKPKNIPLLVKIYFTILKPRYWVLLLGLAVLIHINVHLQASQVFLSIAGLSVIAVLSFTVFLFYADIMTREQWRIPFLRRDTAGLLVLPGIIHICLSLLPYLPYVFLSN